MASARASINLRQTIRFRASWPAQTLPDIQLKAQCPSHITTTPRTTGSIVRTFSSTSALAKRSKGPQNQKKKQQEDQSQQSKSHSRATDILSRLDVPDRLDQTTARESEYAMSDLMQKVHAISDDQLSTDTNSSQSRQAELDRIYADMEYVHAARHNHTAVARMLRHVPVVSDPSSIVKAVPSNEEALANGKKALMASFRCAVPTVFAPWFVYRDTAHTCASLTEL